MRFFYLPLCLAVLALSGCEKDTATTEAEEEQNPLVKQGQSYMDAHDYAQAETAFKQAIDKNPKMARPYLDLAIIYHQYKPDYVASIYYYKRYLELRPDTEKAGFITEQITKVQMALANTILQQSGATQAIKELKQLRRENAELKRQLAVRPKVPAPEKTVTQTIPKSAKPAPAPAPAPNKPTHQVYTVVSGDTLTKIAKKFYGNSNYDPIYEANKDRMKSPRDLRIGQTLVIPMPAK
jgi:tetratricopeptide (TPR) repeat protein